MFSCGTRVALCSFEGPGGVVSRVFPVVLARGKHLFPFRTEQLSPSAPMVLGSQGPGRVGRRRFIYTGRPRAARSLAWPPGTPVWLDESPAGLLEGDRDPGSAQTHLRDVRGRGRDARPAGAGRDGGDGCVRRKPALEAALGADDGQPQ